MEPESGAAGTVEPTGNQPLALSAGAAEGGGGRHLLAQPKARQKSAISRQTLWHWDKSCRMLSADLQWEHVQSGKAREGKSWPCLETSHRTLGPGGAGLLSTQGERWRWPRRYAGSCPLRAFKARTMTLRQTWDSTGSRCILRRVD